MDLLQVVNGVVVPSKFALMTQPFKGMWEDDDTENKVEVLKAFTYVEFICSPKRSNPFILYDEESRIPKVIKEVYGDPDYRLDSEIMYAVITYKDFLAEESSYYGLLTSATAAAVKLRNYLNDFSLNERTNAGGMLIKPKDITSALNEIPIVIKRIQELRIKVSSDVEEEGKTTKEREIGPYEL